MWDDFLAWIKSFVGGSKPSMSWEKRLTRPMCFFSAPNYYWMEADANAVCDAILAAGLDGPSIEFGGPDTAKEYNHEPVHGGVKDRYKANIKAWGKWQKAIESRGLVAHIAFLNTNSSRNNTLSDADWTALANEFTSAHGTKNKIILPASEADPRTRPSIRNSLDRAFRAKFPSRQVISQGAAGEGYSEYHSQKGTDIPSGGRQKLVVSDSGPAIGYLYGGDWRNGGSTNLTNIAQYVSTCKSKGVSCGVYSFGKKFDKEGCKTAGKAWR